MEESYKLGINGISIGTDTLLEKCPMDYLADTLIYVNLRTIVRNALQAAITKDPIVLSETIKERVKQDIETFRMVVEGTNSRVIVYHVDYERLPKKALVNYYTPRTEKQIAYNKLYLETTVTCLEFVEPSHNYHKGFKPSDSDFMLLSHYTYDLITAGNKRMLLVESHTGIVKRPKDWNTKLNLKPEDREYIPFNPITYYIFGDKGNDYVVTANKILKSQIRNIATKYDWSSATTLNRVQFCLQEEDVLLYEATKQFLKN